MHAQRPAKGRASKETETHTERYHGGRQLRKVMCKQNMRGLAVGTKLKMGEERKP